MAELAHWEGWELDVWLGWVEEDGAEPEPPPVPAVTGSLPFYDVEVYTGMRADPHKRKRLIRRMLLLG